MHQIKRKDVEVELKREREPSAESIAQLMDAVYPSSSEPKMIEYYKWRYQYAFHAPAKSVSFSGDGKLIGHAAVFTSQYITKHGVGVIAQLGDLAVHPEHRSSHIVRLIYRELKEVISNDKYLFAITTPNSRSIKLNQRFLNLKSVLRLNFWFGLVVPKINNKFQDTYEANAMLLDNANFMETLNTCLKSQDGEMFYWTPDQLIYKCSDPSNRHFFHITDQSVIITTNYRKFGISVFIVKFAASTIRSPQSYNEIKKLLKVAARHHKTPFFITWGVNVLLDEFRKKHTFMFETKKNISVQASEPVDHEREFSRLELIDFDIY